MKAVQLKCCLDEERTGLQLGLLQKLSWEGAPQALLCPVGGGCFVDNVSEGLGGGVTCPGGQGIFDPEWGGR